MRKRRQLTLREQALERLPLRPAALAVLSALAQGPRAGFEVLATVNDTLPGLGLLGPGTLYRLLRELRQDGLIHRVEAAGLDDTGDERRSYSELTELGRATLLAEVERLRRTLKSAGLLDRLRGA